MALLKRFKVPDEMDGIGNNRGSNALRTGQDLDAFFQELDEFSCGEGDDSCPDMDSLSVGSTPKPSLRPFFSNSRSALHDSLIGGELHFSWDSFHTYFLLSIGGIINRK